MRFKAMIEQPASIIRMLTSLSHMAKDCLIVLGSVEWKIILNEKFVPASHPQCYASTPIAYVFSHYMIESQANNEILLQINIKNLLAAFKSVKDNKFSNGMTIIKLTKKSGIAMLSFEMWEDSGTELRVNVIQDVTVKPTQHSKLYLYEEPQVSQYHASCKCPPLKSLKTVIERMRIINTNTNNEHGILYISNHNGQLLLEIKTDHCMLKTIYNNLGLDNQQLHDQNTDQRKENVRAKIDLKNLLKVVQSLQPLNIKQTVIAITKRTCVTIHTRLNEFHTENNNNNNNNNDDDENVVSARITFYLCVYIDDDDDEDNDDDNDNDNEQSDDDDERSITEPTGPSHDTSNDQEMRNID